VSCLHNWRRGSRSFVMVCRTLLSMPKVLTDLPDDVVALLSIGHGPFSAQAARLVGISNDRLCRLVAAGLLTRVWHGCYMATNEYLGLSLWDRHAAEARALAIASPGACITSWSAVAVWGLPALGSPPSKPSIVWEKSPGLGPSTTPPGRHLVAGIPADRRVELGQARLVSMAWAAVDIARKAPIASALVVADAAARRGADLVGAVADMRRWPGVIRARWVAQNADPGSETALETLGRFTCIEFCLPMPVSNAWVGRDGPTYRVDGLWPWHWAASEADGAIKYDNRPDAAAIVQAQTEREWYLRRLGLDIARYDWQLAIRQRHVLASRFAALLRDNPPRQSPIRWWKHVPGMGPVDPEPADWPSPLPTDLLLPGKSSQRRR
jgi:hypothetical protein